MTARIIVVLNHKGGAGKTTVCLSLAGELHRRGHRVLVADCDPEGNAVRWALAAPVDMPFPATVLNLSALRERVHRELHRYLPDYDFLLVDTPPHGDLVSSSALLVADLCLIPMQPSPLNMWKLQAIQRLIEAARKTNTALQAVIVPAKVGRTCLGGAILEELGRFGFPVLKTRLMSRVAYDEATLAGTTVCALPRRRGGAAAAEMEAITDEVLDLLGEPQ